MNRYLKKFLPLLASPALILSVAGSFLLLPAGVMPSAAQEADNEDKDGPEVLTRGPVHEAFAETIAFKPSKGILVPKAPPALIEEIPPDQRPDGDNVTWIPGYWAWDDEANDFLWISGIWRNVPPNRQWVPGSWQEADSQYQWVSGYWADADAQEVDYLPEPPTSLEAGPNIPQPSNESVWISGSWMWNNESHYRWRPGYWDAGRPDWAWCPSHYVWSPRGYIYVDGYWDYDVPRRGCLFAPVRFRPGWTYRPEYRYRPSIVVSTSAFLEHLFLRPRCNHYYFGDYYAPEYRRSGFIASYNYFSGRHGYDPIFAHQRWEHRDDNRWERRRADDFAFFRDHRDERPPHTFAAYQKFEKRPDRIRRDGVPIATPLSQFVITGGDKGGRLKFKPVNDDDRKKFETHGREIRDFGRQYAKSSEAAPFLKPQTGKGKKGDKATAVEPARVKIPRSPVLSKVNDNSPNKADIPPPRHEKGNGSNPPGDDNTGRGKKGKGNDGQPGNPGNDPADNTGRGKKGKGNDGQPDATGPGKGSKVEPGTPNTPGNDKVDPRGRGDKGKGADEPGGKRGKGEPKSEPKNPGDDSVNPRGKGKGTGEDEPKHKQPKSEPSNPRGNDSVNPRGNRGKGAGDDQPKHKQPKVEPQPRVEPRQPKIDPQPKQHEPKQPKFEPRNEPRPQPKIEPRPQPRTQPKFEPRPQPQPQPQPQPNSGGGKGNGGNGDKGDKKKDKHN